MIPIDFYIFIVFRVLIIIAIGLVIYKQIVILPYKAPANVVTLKRLLLALTIIMLVSSLVILALDISVLSQPIDNDLALTADSLGDDIYIVNNVIGDIISAAIVYIIYKGADL